MDGGTFYTLLELDIFTKNWAYIFMGVTVVVMLGWWLYISSELEEDESPPRPK